ncbi:DUF1616 domain-containing protein [Halobacteria archaeon AArc-m2/3/4]|uniref:DUF1616 domain-containing protein n=1 Tax=Natronoglomus mannanivorans TaxID=2979990 RepID=A0ABT2QGT5_9EURY|nr:DUF1616 domain-containing protein [Halobacteria archaeon AArc-m2/3/4]
MSDSDWWYVDLAAVVAVTGLATFGLLVDPPSTVRIVLALPLLLFCPGYALVSVLFPDDVGDEQRSFDDWKTGLQNPVPDGRGLDSIERFVLSVVLSIALVPTVALGSSITPWGVTVRPILVGIGLVTITLALAGIVARLRCAPERRFTPSLASVSVTSLGFSSRSRSAYDSTNTRVFNVALACSLVILLASAGYAIANPPQGDGFTEFYVETEPVTGDTETMYEASYTSGESQDLTVFVDNQEHRDVTYTTVVQLQRVDYADGNGDGGGEEEGTTENTATVLETDELTRDSITVADGQRESQTLEVTPTMAGDDLRLVVLLYEGEPPSEPSTDDAYRVIRLPVDVA